MDVAVLVVAGCCLFSCCVWLFLRVYYGPDASLGNILTKGLVGEALQGFEFDTSSGLPNIQKRTKTIKPQSFKSRPNFAVPAENNIGPPQDKDDVNCSVLCFDTEGCTG